MKRFFAHSCSIVVATCVLASVGAVAADGSTTLPPYQAFVTANPSAHGCFAKRGFYVGLQTQLKKRLKPAELSRLARANRPRRAVLRVAGHTYKLSVDEATSVRGNRQIGWNFHVILASRKMTRTAVGKRATVSYESGAKLKRRHARSRVLDGTCRSLI